MTRNSRPTMSEEVDILIDALANPRRRAVLDVMRTWDDGNVTFYQLTSRVAAEIHGTTPSAVTYDQKNNVRTSLHQAHIPKLEEYDVVAPTGDVDANTPIVPGPRFEDATEILAFVRTVVGPV